MVESLRENCHWNTYLSVSENLYVHITHSDLDTWCLRCLLVIQNELFVSFLSGTHKREPARNLNLGIGKHGVKSRGWIRLRRNGSPGWEEKGRRGPRDAANEIRREPRELKVTWVKVVQGQEGQLCWMLLRGQRRLPHYQLSGMLFPRPFFYSGKTF